MGVGLPHLFKSGTPSSTAAGLTALVAGLVLLVLGTATLICLVPGWRRLLAVPAVYVVLQFLVLPVNIGIYAANVPSDGPARLTPADAGLAYQTVTFHSSDGVPLAGWLRTLPQRRRPRRGPRVRLDIGAIGADGRVRAVVAEGVSYTTAGLLTDAPRPPPLRTSLRAAAPRPILLVEGRDELTVGRYLKDSSPANVRLWELPDTAHTVAFATHPNAWVRRVVDFLATNLRR